MMPLFIASARSAQSKKSAVQTIAPGMAVDTGLWLRPNVIKLSKKIQKNNIE
jgi:hypothetical protein